MNELIIATVCWFLGGLYNGIAGFGAAMIAMPLLTPYVALSVAVPSCTLIVFLLNFQVGWVFRHYTEWRAMRGILLGAMAGAAASFLFLRYIPEMHLKVGMGIFICGYAFWGMWSETRLKAGSARGWSYLAGFFSSALGMAFGFNGPPLAVYASYCGFSAQVAKGLFGAGFIVTGACIVLMKTLSGEMTPEALRLALVSVPAVLLGSRLGIHLASSLKEGSYRKILFATLLVMGLHILWTAFR